MQDGTKRALYLWRRVYGEKQPPEKGFPIEEPGKPSERYASLSKVLGIKEQEVFWNGIWDLAHDPKRLEDLGVTGVSGHAVYHQARPGLVYTFKISGSGKLSIEASPEI